MTDESIEEAFIEFMQKTVPIRDIDFSRTLVCCVGDFDNIMLQSHAVGFIGGYRAAERLAKIEVLEPVLLMMDKLRFFSVADYKDAKDRIDTMIAELKEGGE